MLEILGGKAKALILPGTDDKASHPRSKEVILKKTGILQKCFCAALAAPTHVLRVQQKTIAKRCNHVTRAGDFPCGAGGRDFCAKHRVCKCRCGRRV